MRTPGAIISVYESESDLVLASAGRANRGTVLLGDWATRPPYKVAWSSRGGRKVRAFPAAARIICHHPDTCNLICNLCHCRFRLHWA